MTKKKIPLTPMAQISISSLAAGSPLNPDAHAFIPSIDAGNLEPYTHIISRFAPVLSRYARECCNASLGHFSPLGVHKLVELHISRWLNESAPAALAIRKAHLFWGWKSPVAKYKAGTAFKRLLYFIQTHNPQRGKT
jgi:hypothetical protein